MVLLHTLRDLAVLVQMVKIVKLAELVNELPRQSGKVV